MRKKEITGAGNPRYLTKAPDEPQMTAAIAIFK
jgi:hypothetical protein